MKKRLVRVKDCRDGDRLALDVYTKNDVLLLTENTKINRYIVNKLMEFGIEKVCVYRISRQYDDVNLEESFQRFVKNYDTHVDSIKAVINDLTVGKSLDYDKVGEITNSLYQGIGEKNNIIRCLSSVKDFDQYTYNHSVNVSLYSMLIGKWLKLSESDIKDVMKSGLLHDIGKSQVPINVLNKRGKLDDMEFEMMKQHPVYGYNLAKAIPGLSQKILEGIVMHHEKENGTGYPFKLNGTEIGYFAKIIAVADVFDALTSERVYKNRMTPFETFEIIERTGYGHFDPKIMMTFLHNIASYYIGTEVVMSNGEAGTVVYVAPHNISRPVVKVGGSYIDMSKENELKIAELTD